MAPTLAFQFVVPGHEQWILRSVRALASRAVGGTPNRAYTLVVTDGTNVVAAIGAADAGTEPGGCSVTWANTPAASVASGANGVTVAPVGGLVLPSGYVLQGAIVGAAAGDTWTSAAVWYDFAYTA